MGTKKHGAGAAWLTKIDFLGILKTVGGGGQPRGMPLDPVRAAGAGSFIFYT